jgi:outer membrane protein TolC
MTFLSTAGQKGSAALLLVVAIAPCAASQDNPSARKITLDEAIQQGIAASQRLAEAQARKQADDAAVASRDAADRPIVAAQAGYTRTNHVDEFAIAVPGQPPRVVYPDIPDNYRTRLDLQWPIYTGGRTDALERAARAEAAAAGEDLAAARADLRLEITRAFWALATADDTADVLRRSLEAIDAQVSDLRARFAQGLIPPNDVSSAEAQQARQRLLALQAANQRAIAEADLRRLTGNEAAGRLEADPGGPAVLPASPEQVQQVADLIAAALRARPERRALEHRSIAAREQIAAASAAWKPQISFGGGYDYARPNPRIFPRTTDWRTSWDASVNLSWTLWDGGRRAADRALAAANAAAVHARAADFDRTLTFEVRQRRLELDSSIAAIAAADEEVRAAADAERVVNERYRAGVATPTDVLEAQVARLQADLDRTRAVADARLAQARLARATGQQP